MKKLFPVISLGIALFLFPLAAGAQTWYPANQRTVAWDPVTTDEAGQPLPAGSTVGYKVYYKTTLATSQVFLIELATPQVTLTLPVEGSYFIGVSAIRKEGDILITETAISWSDIPANCQGGQAFGIRFYKTPAPPRNLRSPSS